MESTLHFSVVAPHGTTSSNGVVLVYKLGAWLESLGHRVTYVPKDPVAFQREPEVYTDELRNKFVIDPAEVDSRSIAIIPETTPDSIIASLASTRRVFYLLNRPYLLTGKPLSYRPDDLVVAYSRLISNAHLNLFITTKIPEFDKIQDLCVQNPEKENIVLIYFGKSRRSQIPPEVIRVIRRNRAKVVIINRVYPKSRELLFDLLRRAKLLVSFDPLTNLNYEATLCGTPCFVADNYMHLDYANYNHPLWGFFEDASEVEKRYAHGISKDDYASILSQYNDAFTNSPAEVRKFVDACTDWFSFVQKAQSNPSMTEFLNSYNNMRLDLDRIAFQASGGQRIDHAFEDYNPESIAATPLQHLLRSLSHRWDRLTWNVRRNWHKHISRLNGDALAAKLEEMRRAYELRKLGSQRLKNSLR